MTAGGYLEDKTIVLGVCGGIAAYKSVEVCRRLVDSGAHVIPVLTGNAEKFVGRTTFDALASEPAVTSLWEDPNRSIPHTQLGRRADLIVVVPATARLIGSYASGIADDALTNTLLATRAPVLLCPAMHTEMWEHPAVQENLTTLRSRGVSVVPPATGRLAGGDEGVGRLAEVGEIVDAVEGMLGPRVFEGLQVLVTAGGTREPIDPVRFVGNRSSGKQGHALAEVAALEGAKVTLVTASSLPVAAGIDVVRVTSASEMADAVTNRISQADVVLMAAAVADYRPVESSPSKLKRSTGERSLTLVPTVDILAEVVARRHPGQVIVGFAAETDDLEANAADKLLRKKVDLIVANDVSGPDTGFDSDDNAVTLLFASGESRSVVRQSKRSIARAVVASVAEIRAKALP